MERPAVDPAAAGVPPAPPAPGPAGTGPLPMLAPPPRDPRDRRDAWEMALRRKRWVRWFVSWLPQRLTYGIRSLLRLQHAVIAWIRLRWRRSLQLRVVGTTLVVSAVMVAVLGFFLTEQIAGGLLGNAETSDREQVITGLSNARSQSGLTTPPPSGQAANQFIYSLDSSLQPTTNSTGSYSVAVGVSEDLAVKPGYSPWAASFDTHRSLPASLLASVEQ